MITLKNMLKKGNRYPEIDHQIKSFVLGEKKNPRKIEVNVEA